MSKKIKMKLEVNASPEELISIMDELKEIEEIEEGSIVQTQTLGLGTAILFAVIPAVISLLIKNAPEIIDFFVRLIQKLLRKGQEKDKEKEIPEVTIIYRLNVYNFNSLSETKILEELNRLRIDLGGKIEQ